MVWTAAWLSVLASSALWNPRFGVRIGAFSDHPIVLPIIFGAIPPACWARGIPRWGRAFVSAARVETARLGSGYSVDVNRIGLRLLPAHHEQTLVVIFVRKGVIGVVVAGADVG